MQCEFKLVQREERVHWIDSIYWGYRSQQKISLSQNLFLSWTQEINKKIQQAPTIRCTLEIVWALCHRAPSSRPMHWALCHRMPLSKPPFHPDLVIGGCASTPRNEREREIESDGRWRSVCAEREGREQCSGDWGRSLWLAIDVGVLFPLSICHVCLT